MKIAVCWKWVSIDREEEPDQRWAGVSPADEAALELALRIGGDSGDATWEVTVFCLGPGGADDTLRTAIAAGAQRAQRIDASPALASHTVAGALAQHLHDADLVLCGDYSIDRGTGSVPAFLAAELGFAQALGLVDVTPTGGGPIRVLRRLDGGRREILDVTLPAVLSVEGSVAQLRRASLSASLASRNLTIEAVPGPHGRPSESEIHPYRPRPRTLAAPVGDSLSRVRAILDVGGDDGHPESVVLEPAQAAQRILDQLAEWGYVDR